jgi:molybdopterin-guanine dinucleotide biosynthesis protein A
VQTLCSVYRKEFAEIAERSLSAGRNRVDAAFAEISVRRISEEELEKAGFSFTMFRNVNTPEEWRQAQREFESPRSADEAERVKP